MTIINLLQTGEKGKEIPKISITLVRVPLRFQISGKYPSNAENFIATDKYLVFFKLQMPKFYSYRKVFGVFFTKNEISLPSEIYVEQGSDEVNPFLCTPRFLPCMCCEVRKSTIFYFLAYQKQERR